MSKNTEWGKEFLELEWTSSWAVMSAFLRKRQFLHRLFFVALSNIKLLFFLSLGRASTGMLCLSKRQKCSSKWEDLEKYKISNQRSSGADYPPIYQKCQFYDLSDLGEEDRTNGLFHDYFMQLLGTACSSFLLLCTGTGKGCLVHPDGNFPG